MIAATPAHAAAMAAIHAAAFPLGERWAADAFAAQLRLPSCFGLIEPAGGLVLAQVSADEAEVLTLGVAPEARRLGVARRLLNAAVATSRARGATALFLEVARGNIPAASLYAAAGFGPVGVRRGYYPDGQDALVLRLALLPTGKCSGPKTG